MWAEKRKVSSKSYFQYAHQLASLPHLTCLQFRVTDGDDMLHVHDNAVQRALNEHTVEGRWLSQQHNVNMHY